MVAGIDLGGLGVGEVLARDTEVGVEGFELGAGIVAVEQIGFGGEAAVDNVARGGGVGGRGWSGNDGKLQTNDEDGSDGGKGARDRFLLESPSVKGHIREGGWR